MRFLSLFSALAAALVFSGCQSCTSPSHQIVGDSTTQWTAPQQGCASAGPATPCALPAATHWAGHCGGGATMTCGDCECGGMGTCGSCLSASPAMMLPFAASSCGGGNCQTAGSCAGGGCQTGGRSGLAYGQQSARHAQALAMMRHHKLMQLVENQKRRCAYGQCGGRPGPEHGMVNFPYYTVRGPRDFLAKNPPSIGP